MNSKVPGRRKFLKEGVALAGLAIGAIQSTSGQNPGLPMSGASFTDSKDKELEAYGERSPFEKSRRAPVSGPPWSQTPLQDQLGIITPSGLHFMRGGPAPNIDPEQHRLLIHGLVDRPVILSVQDLRQLPSISRIYFIECSGNSRKMSDDSVQLTHGDTACSEWTGVSLALLLREVGVRKGAKWLVSEGADPRGQLVSIPLEKAMDDILVAYGQNGEALRREQGYPLRLIIPGWVGTTHTKWLKRIKLVEQPYMTRWETGTAPNLRMDGKARWFEFQLGPKSVITFPSGGLQLHRRGFHEITGLAWSGAGAIRRVEVSTDGGPKLAGCATPGAGASIRPYSLSPGMELEWRRSGAPVPLHG